MSDQRPEWMPSNKEIQENNVCPCDDCVAMCYRTGLRAQIAVLEELAATPRINGIELKLAALRKEIENE